MQYRRLGRTGLQVSEIGMGCEGLTDHEGKYMKDFLDYAVQAGINYLDFYAPDPRMRRLLGEALLGRRESHRGGRTSSRRRTVSGRGH